jgi:hypothetical protein
MSIPRTITKLGLDYHLCFAAKGATPKPLLDVREEEEKEEDKDDYVSKNYRCKTVL